MRARELWARGYRQPMVSWSDPPSPRLRRLVDELDEHGVDLDVENPLDRLVAEEIDYALHPLIHERRVPTYGAVIAPTVDRSRWRKTTNLEVTSRSLRDLQRSDARRFADGASSWLVLSGDGAQKLAVFDRPASSERDVVVMVDAFGAAIVQRHSSGTVRYASEHGVMRWDGMSWHREPLVTRWISAMRTWGGNAQHSLATLLAFAVHDLGARGIGALLIMQNTLTSSPAFEQRMAEPPPLDIAVPEDLTPLRHVLAQIDGAAVFDNSGILRQIGVRLNPSAAAVADVDGHRGMRHTSGRRYSFDDPESIVIVVSEDGPVTMMRNGVILGRTDAQA